MQTPSWKWRKHVPPAVPKTPQARVGMVRRYQNRRMKLCHHQAVTLGHHALYDWVMTWKWEGA